MDEGFDDDYGDVSDYGDNAQADFDAASSIGQDTYNDNRGGDSPEDYNSFVTGKTPQQAYTIGRGASSTNPFPDSFFSKMFGAENVDYTNIIGSGRINEINDLRYRQATGQMSEKTGEQYQAGDYYIGQDTNMGTVKPIPSMGQDIMNFMPGGGIINAIVGQKGLPENDPRYQEIMNEKAKSANDPTVFDRVSDYVKEVTGFGPKDAGNSLAAGSVAEGQMRVPDNRTFDAFGNESATEINFPNSFSSRPEPEGFNTVINPITGRMELRENKSKYEQQADMSSTFRDIGSAAQQAIGADGYPVFDNPNLRLNLGIDRETQEPQGKLTYSTNFFG